MGKVKQRLKYALAAIVVLFVAIQFVPYGRDHSNPPLVSEPNWDSQQTRDLAARACFDCHSNEVKWPLYSNVAPVSWFIQQHVDEGRQKLNFSDWANSKDKKKMVKEVEEGKMPLQNYLPLHPAAQLSDAEKQQLIEGLGATYKNNP